MRKKERELRAEVERLRDELALERVWGSVPDEAILTTAHGLVSQVVTARGARPRMTILIEIGVERLVNSMDFEIDGKTVKPDDPIMVIVARR